MLSELHEAPTAGVPVRILLRGAAMRGANGQDMLDALAQLLEGGEIAFGESADGLNMRPSPARQSAGVMLSAGEIAELALAVADARRSTRPSNVVPFRRPYRPAA
jgi:hypothetical protein